MLIVFELPEISIVDARGRDAVSVLNNLTTNDLKKLEPGDGVETFITNVKGKCVGHVMVYRTDEGLRLVGTGGQSAAIAAHIDRYVIREDIAVSPSVAIGRAILVVHPEKPEAGHRVLQRRLGDHPIEAITVPWMGNEESAEVWFIPELVWRSLGQLAVFTLVSASLPPSDLAMRMGNVDEFHAFRIAAGFPWYGQDLTDEHLPQEAGRNSQTISFTKGCYLGQETVARLDALGQVQKQLVQLRLEGLPENELPTTDAKLYATWDDEMAGSKPVVRLTSLANFPDLGAIAIGFARRSHFDAGSTAVGRLPGDDRPFTATVVTNVL